VKKFIVLHFKGEKIGSDIIKESNIQFLCDNVLCGSNGALNQRFRKVHSPLFPNKLKTQITNI
jgi:hypothetical protein